VLAGDRDAYRDELWYYLMLRPIVSWDGLDSAALRADGTATTYVELRHITPATAADESVATVFRLTRGEPPPAPDPAGARRGEPHRVDLVLVPSDGGHAVDTDILALLRERLGPLEELVLPLSRAPS
jgi:hypothetical protein